MYDAKQINNSENNNVKLIILRHNWHIDYHLVAKLSVIIECNEGSKNEFTNIFDFTLHLKLVLKTLRSSKIIFISIWHFSFTDDQ